MSRLLAARTWDSGSVSSLSSAFAVCCLCSGRSPVRALKTISSPDVLVATVCPCSCACLCKSVILPLCLIATGFAQLAVKYLRINAYWFIDEPKRPFDPSAYLCICVCAIWQVHFPKNALKVNSNCGLPTRPW